MGLACWLVHACVQHRRRRLRRRQETRTGPDGGAHVRRRRSDTHWRFTSARQTLYEARLAGWPQPWTDDPILSRHRFTNCHRAADLVSQTLIGDVIHQESRDWDEVFFHGLAERRRADRSEWPVGKRLSFGGRRRGGAGSGWRSGGR
ncbi:putative DNA base hypermodification protein [Streptomyces sp. NBC_01136]|uniref:nucleotide kinase domain-containing protein n=1 Tax=unclassified Streptomyces TaxID=2593676 RepID=UPI00324E12E6|nr:putative DNA base hypermodification protein [Streptomyces sp. NBC_01136]WST81229.1 putative DNA base hypermodification protein [Streptomyces sp. NBC_01136]